MIDPDTGDRVPDGLGGEFEFQAGISTTKGILDADGQPQTYYTVRLPHQCDHWVITETPDRATAIAETELFIAEAREALAALKEAT